MGNSGGQNYCSITAVMNNSIAIDSSGAASLNSGDTLNSQANWVSSGTALIEYVGMTGFQGNWQYKDNYLAVKFYAGSTLYYGWIHMFASVNQGAVGINLKEYAYSTSLITAGEGSNASIQKNNAKEDFSIYPNPAKDVVKIKSSMINEGALIITDVLGNIVIKIPFNNQQISFETRDLNEGIYNITLQSSQNVVSKRLVIVK